MKSLSILVRLSILLIYLLVLGLTAHAAISALSKVKFNLLPAAHGSTLKSTMVKVAVIDTGLDLTDKRFRGRLCEGSKDFTGTGLKDTHGHGTHIASTIMKYAGPKANYCLLILKYYSETATGQVNLARMIEAEHYAAEQRVNLVNVSGGGPEANDEEKMAIAAMPWAVYVVAAGNDQRDVVQGRYPAEGSFFGEGSHGYYPAAYGLSNIVVVGALDTNGHKASYSNFGPAVRVWEPGEVEAFAIGKGTKKMHGTSQAAAVLTGKMLAGEALQDLFNLLSNRTR